MNALVTGGTGFVGQAVVRQLAAEGINGAFTWHTQSEVAAELASETGFQAIQLDLQDLAAIRAVIKPAAIFAHCAAIGPSTGLADTDDDVWDAVYRINVRSAACILDVMAPEWRRNGSGDVVLLSALAKNQSLPLPIAFATSQGALSAMAMAVAHELGPAGVRINVVAAGALDGGLSKALDPGLVESFQQFCSFRRLGTASEVARLVVWLAVTNRYMSGKVFPINGGM